MDAGNISAIIAACAGIGGVLLGNGIVAIKEWSVNRHQRKKDAEYLAIIVVSHLERFANGCLNVAFDDGTEEGRPAGNNGDYWQETTTSPTIQPLDFEVEWKSLPLKLMYSVLRIPDKQVGLLHRIAGFHDSSDWPEYTEYFWARRQGHAELGIEVTSVANQLREHTGMPVEKHYPGAWHIEVALQEAIDAVALERRARDKRVEENQKKREIERVSTNCFGQTGDAS